jgi:cytochrome P450
LETSVALITAHHLDVTSPDFDPCGPAVAEARAAGWWADTPLGPAILRHEDVLSLLRDRRFGQGSAINLDIQHIGDGPLRRWWRDLILNVEGSRHDRLRRLVVPAFRPPIVDALRPHMRTQIDAIIAEVVGDAAVDEHVTCDAVASIADPYPVAVLSELLGIPADERPLVRRWANDIGYAFSFAVAAHLADIEAAVVGLHEVADRLVADRRQHPGEDFVSQLVAAEEAGDRLSEDELRNVVVATLFAGHDTTKHQLAQALSTFVAHPAAWDALAADPSLAPTAVEEVLRVAPAVPVILRLALEDVTYRELELPAGSLVLLIAAAANSEPAVYGETRFDISAIRPRQLTFGGGVHHCVGHLLARAELAEALPRLARAMHELRIAGPVTWRPPTGIAGPTALPLAFRARRQP